MDFLSDRRRTGDIEEERPRPSYSENQVGNNLIAGYWQVKMHPGSIEWTAFTCPEGHFEWLAMPFGLKTAPPIFQRKMDEIFGEYKN